MAGSVKILSIEESLFRRHILIEAVTDCEVEWDSLIGPRIFYMKKGDRRIIKMSKSDVAFLQGEEVAFSSVCTGGLSNTAFQFKWHWA